MKFFLPFQRILRSALLLGTLSLAVTRLHALPAFPGAEGFGRDATGGRGGTVYHVTNLNDSGAGSFRDAVSVANRTVVFDVGGIIVLTSGRVAIKNNITIAGQTAPGDGIAIYGNGVSFSNASNTICRYIRFRQGINGDSGTDAVGIASGSNMIFDHVSASWGRDETFSVSGSPISNISLQDCIIGQGLMIHSAGGLMQTDGGVSIFRTLYIDNWMRNPKIKGVSDYQNNVVYNWGSGGGYIPAGDSAGDTYANMIGNYFIGGPDTGVGTSPFKTGNQNYRLFHSDNLQDLNLDGALNGTAVTDASFTTLQLVGVPFVYPAPITTLTSNQALQHVLAYSGASLRRDSVDANMVNEVLTYGTGGNLIFNESEVGGIGTIAAGLTPTDTDQDGMPDWWEQAAGTNPAVADNNGDLNADGYTNLENYINALTIVGIPGVFVTGIATDTGSANNDAITFDNTIAISGTAAPGVTVTLYRVDSAIALGTATANGSGQWTFDYSSTVLADRYYAFYATADLGGGKTSPASPVLAVKIDTVPAAAPTISSIVTSPAFAFNGTAEPFAGIVVTLNGGTVGTTTANSSGLWTALYSGAPLAPGVYSFTATATDIAGNTGVASAPYVIDTSLTAPTFTSITTDSGTSSSDRITNDTTLTLAGTAPANSTVTIFRAGLGSIGTAPATAGGAWSLVYGTTLVSGQYTFTATASAGGNSSAASAPFLVTVDTVAPTIPSLVRFNPSSTATSSGTLVFRVTWIEPVLNVDTTDFVLTTTGGVIGTVSAVAPVSTSVYDVTVTGVAGDGTIRLDRKANATVVDFAGNSVSTGTFTGGQSYTIRAAGSGVWLNDATGGLWSDSTNWDPSWGGVANGTTATADFSILDLAEDNVVKLDTARTIGRLVFADADQSSPATWTLSNNGNAANILTLASATTPTIQTIFTGAAGDSDGTLADASLAYPVTFDLALAGSAGLAKTGLGTALFTRPLSISGALSVTQGSFKLGTGSSLTSGTVTVGVSARFHIAGGTFNGTGTTTITNGGNSGIYVSGGTATFARIVTTGDRDGVTKVTGGTLNSPELSIGRSSNASNVTNLYQVGYVMQGGTANFGKFGIATGNSYAAASIEGGETNVSGEAILGWQQTATPAPGRGGFLRVTGGRFNVTEPVTGLVLNRKNGTNSANIAVADFLGGVSTLEKITFGYDNTVTAGSGTVTVNGGALYLGSGGIVKNATAAMVSAVNLTGGTLGAKAPWSTSHPIVLNGTAGVIKTASETNVANDIALNGAISGAGGFAKTGAGTLTLGGASTFAGNLDLNAGTLALTGSLAAGGTFNINSGGLLTGAGTSNKAIALNSGGTISPGIGNAATLNGSSFTWNGGGGLTFDIGAASDKIALTGAFNKGTAGTYNFALNSTVPVALGQSYTVLTYGSTNFTDGDDFTVSGLGNSGVGPWNGALTINANSLVLTISSDGSGVSAFNAWIAPYGIPAGQNGPKDDFDGDGMSNLLEFILALNPTVGGVDGVVLTQVTVGPDVYPALQFKRRQARGDVLVQARASSTLDSTNSLGTVEVSATPQTDATDLVIVRSATSLATQPTQFLRLFVKFP